MASNYPDEVDAFTGPNGSVPMNAAPRAHSVRHRDADTAIMALEEKVGTGASRAVDADEDDVLTRNADGTTGWKPAPGGAAPAAEDVPFTPAGTIAATNVQDAIEEVAAEAGGLPSDIVASDNAGGAGKEGFVFGGDTNLYRDSANNLKSDDSMEVGGNFRAQQDMAAHDNMGAQSVNAGGLFGGNQAVRLIEVSGGGAVQLLKAGATNNPGANNARLFIVDGTTAGTLKLVIRAGAGGAETTILDNIPQ